ncbi:MAG TPA: hypothetical protein VHM28_12420 [Anaerolineales bacterium]|jgi:hypothetical protein|nr:hypothetical protein [Anaerolineales bacterium]
MEGFVLRIGTFFLVIGVGIFILFIASNYAHQANFDYLCAAVTSVTIGILIRRRKAPPPPSGRFALWNRMRSGSKKKDEHQK